MSEHDPLIPRSTRTLPTDFRPDIHVAPIREGSSGDGEAFDHVPKSKRQIGVASAAFLIFNRMVGSGIYATPSIILRTSGSVGMSLCMWLVGAVVAMAGTAVYVELGTGLPRSGGEKNYLEFIYRRPMFLATCGYAMYAVFLTFSASNTIVISEYMLHVFGIPRTEFNSRLGGMIPITFAAVLHGTRPAWGLRLQNGLGFFKLALLLSIPFCGIMSSLGVYGFRIDESHRAHNFDPGKVWEGSHLQANAIVSALYAVIWSFTGYSNANYALSEAKNPVRTIKTAAPLAVLTVALVFISTNVSYFLVVPKSEIINGGQVVAALFFGRLFGPSIEKVLGVSIALSTLGNILAGMFSQGRVTQELAREGILPFSSFFASNKPFNAPLPGLSWQLFISSVVVLGVPPGDAYSFTLNLSSYPLTLINILISAGLLFLYTKRASSWDWSPPFKAWKVAVTFFLGSNIFLAVAPLVPPVPGSSVYINLPYWLHIIVSVAILILGMVYWYVWCILLPRRCGYTLKRELVLQDDGVSRNVFTKVPLVS